MTNLSLHPYPYCSKIVLIQGLSQTLGRSQILCLFKKKREKQIVDNYRPVSLLPILGKIFERVIFNSIFSFLKVNNFLCPNQSGFRPSDSCEYQLLSILNEIYKYFDFNPPKDVRDIFLDLSKALDRVWHDGLIYKIQCIGITDNSLEVIESFLSNRFQGVVLNGQSSS